MKKKGMCGADAFSGLGRARSKDEGSRETDAGSQEDAISGAYIAYIFYFA
jgi:hypothetical protein